MEPTNGEEDPDSAATAAASAAAAAPDHGAFLRFSIGPGGVQFGGDMINPTMPNPEVPPAASTTATSTSDPDNPMANAAQSDNTAAVNESGAGNATAHPNANVHAPRANIPIRRVSVPIYAGRGAAAPPHQHHPHMHHHTRDPRAGARGGVGARDLRGRFGRRIQIRLDGRGGRGGRFPIRATVNGRPHPVRVNFHGNNRNPAAAAAAGRNNDNNNQPRQGPQPVPHHHHHHQMAVRLPSLQTQPLPDSRQQLKSNNENNDDDVDDAFKCSICYEIMNDPVGCGKCSARFCFSCLRRVTELAVLQQHQQAATGMNVTPTPPKCPVCRSEIADPGDIEHDANLRGRIEQLPAIPCRFQGCQERLSRSQITLHEVQCSHVRVKCRYHSFGCNWEGKRGDAGAHEQNGCHLARVSELVERLREARVQMASLQQIVMANGGMMELQRVRMQRESNQVSSTGNLFHLLQFVHMMTCCTPRFLVSKDSWAAFHGDTVGRAVVANFLTLLPTNVLILKTMGASYTQMIVASNAVPASEEKFFDFVDGLLYLLILCCLAVIIGLCFFADTGAPNMWQRLPFPLPQALGGSQRLGSTHVLQYAVTFAVLAAHALALENTDNVLRATLLWIWLCFASTLFPSVVTFLSMSTNSLPQVLSDMTVQLVFQAGRAVHPVWFSLCYAPCLSLGVLPCLDAAVLLYLARDLLKKVSFVELVFQVGEGNFYGNPFSYIPLPAFYVYSGARLAMRATEFPNVPWMQSFDFLAVAVMVFSTRFLLFRIMRVGTQLGLIIMSHARVRSNPHAMRYESSGCGVALFAIWSLLLGAIVAT